MTANRTNLFELSSTIIQTRCLLVASGTQKYDFPGRLRTCEQYLALIKLFARLDFKRDGDLLAGALAVYGWMPTMMDGLGRRDQLKSLIADLSQSKTDHVVPVLEQHRTSGALRAVNNSIVGTSKLLHFFLPDKIAIWDSVLGRSFGLVHRHQLNREDRFITYIAAMHEATQRESMPWDKLDLAGESNALSKIRQIEFALYAFGRLHFGADAARPSNSA